MVSDSLDDRLRVASRYSDIAQEGCLKMMQRLLNDGSIPIEVALGNDGYMASVHVGALYFSPRVVLYLERFQAPSTTPKGAEEEGEKERGSKCARDGLTRRDENSGKSLHITLGKIGPWGADTLSGTTPILT